MRYLLLFSLIHFYINLAKGQTQNSSREMVHPEPVNWINGKPSLSNSEYKIIDFWFTSCAPCVYTMPHLNRLNSQFGTRITFQSITFDNEEKVNDFLKHHPIDFSIGIDTSKRVINFFDINAYPTTLILKGDSVIWKGYPNALTSQLITDLTGYTPIFSSVDLKTTMSVAEKSKERIEIIKNGYIKGKASGSQTTPDEIFYVNQGLAAIFSKWLGINKNQIISGDSNKYDIRYQLPANAIETKKMDGFIESLVDELDLTVTYRERDVKGYEAFVTNESKLDNHKTNHLFSSRSTYDDRWEGKGITTPELFYEIENIFNIYIESGPLESTQRYDFILPISLSQLTLVLASDYGISLCPKKVTKSFYYID